MLKRTRVLALTLSVLSALAGTSVFAQTSPVEAKSSGTHTGKLNRIDISSSGTFVALQFKRVHPDCREYLIDVSQTTVSQAGLNNLVKAALAAAENGRSVSVWFHQPSSECHVYQLDVHFGAVP